MTEADLKRSIVLNQRLRRAVDADIDAGLPIPLAIASVLDLSRVLTLRLHAAGASMNEVRHMVTELYQIAHSANPEVTAQAILERVQDRLQNSRPDVLKQVRRAVSDAAKEQESHTDAN